MVNRCLLQHLKNSAGQLGIRLIMPEGCVCVSEIDKIAKVFEDIALVVRCALESHEEQLSNEAVALLEGTLFSAWLACRLRRVALSGINGKRYYKLPVHAYETGILVSALETAAQELLEQESEEQKIALRVLERLRKQSGRAEPVLESFRSLSSKDRFERLRELQERYEFPEHVLATSESRDFNPTFAEVSYSLLPKPLKPGSGEPDEILDVYDVEAVYDDVAGGDEEDAEEPVRMAAASVIRIPPGSYGKLFTACDSYSGDLLDAYETCFDESGRPVFPLREPVWVLDRFLIETGYERAAELFLGWIIDNICRWTGSLVVFPVREMNQGGEGVLDTSSEGMARMREFLASQGFLPLRNTSYMFFNMF